MAGGGPKPPRSLKTVGESGAPSVSPSNPNSRRGRKARSPIRQGRVTMESSIVGIDVSKDRLDVGVRPSGERFAVARNAAGLEQLVARLHELSPGVIALEATGGFETIAAATLAAAGLPVVIVNPAQIRAFAKAVGQRAKSDPIDRSMFPPITRCAVPSAAMPMKDICSATTTKLSKVMYFGLNRASTNNARASARARPRFRP